MEIINLDMTPSTVTPNAHAGQYDASRTVRFMLKNGGVPFTLAGTETITAEITRSDNTEVTVNVANTSSNYVDVVFDDTVCTVKGLYACELRLKDSDGLDIGSKNFALLVQRDPYDGAGIHVETVGPADICTFETSLAEPLQSVLVNVEATGGNGTPDNPNPINGYTEANITRCGVNLLNPDTLEKRKVSSSNIQRLSFAPMWLGSGSYTLSFSGSQSIYLCDINNNYATTEITPNMLPYTLTLTERKLIMFRFSVDTVGELTDTNIQLEIGNYSEYHPYNGQTYTIAFGQTVYGGVPDVTRGKLHVTWGGIDLGSLDWHIYGGDKFYTTISDLKLPTTTAERATGMLCSIFKPSSNLSVGEMDNYSFLRFNQSENFWVRDTAYSDTATFKAAMNGIKLVYELATPFDIDLTPEVISAVVGENNVFADCGETTVKYLKAGE